MVPADVPWTPSLDGERIMRVDKTGDDTFALSEVIRSREARRYRLAELASCCERRRRTREGIPWCG